ncbi:hypothetical protein B0I35DRAFT_237592 [Stachybotrys elegans]|uniref:Uncharacterized protein n=1 Tax=Stachybotrys elegans TaxID=80388 RepID=A0A8K0SNM5_9HYPO|nr:hypothetical protein B0I35DRAFT_237592 [Stachybotrys elegans]
MPDMFRFPNSWTSPRPGGCLAKNKEREIFTALHVASGDARGSGLTGNTPLDSDGIWEAQVCFARLHLTGLRCWSQQHRPPRLALVPESTTGLGMRIMHLQPSVASWEEGMHASLPLAPPPCTLGHRRAGVQDCSPAIAFLCLLSFPSRPLIVPASRPADRLVQFWPASFCTSTGEYCAPRWQFIRFDPPLDICVCVFFFLSS